MRESAVNLYTISNESDFCFDFSHRTLSHSVDFRNGVDPDDRTSGWFAAWNAHGCPCSGLWLSVTCNFE